MERTLVAGGAGFLGSNLCDFLLSEGHEVICMDNLITGSMDNIAHIKSERFHFVNHDVSRQIEVDGPLERLARASHGQRGGRTPPPRVARERSTCDPRHRARERDGAPLNGGSRSRRHSHPFHVVLSRTQKEIRCHIRHRSDRRVRRRFHSPDCRATGSHWSTPVRLQ